jgi:pimeloyl-ACP methyl ester carboxylesterase
MAVPVMVVASTKDHLSPAKEAGRYASDLVVVKGAGHMLLDESPHEVNDALVRFFRVPARPGLYFGQA